MFSFPSSRNLFDLLYSPLQLCQLYFHSNLSLLHHSANSERKETDTHTHTQIERDRDRDRETERKRQRDRERERERERERDRDRETERKRERERDKIDRENKTHFPDPRTSRGHHTPRLSRAIFCTINIINSVTLNLKTHTPLILISKFLISNSHIHSTCMHACSLFLTARIVFISPSSRHCFITPCTAVFVSNRWLPRRSWPLL